MLRRSLLLAGAVLLATNGLAAAQSSAPVPSGYPADYASLIEQSKSDPEIVVYSNLQLANWEKVSEGFKARYPWTTLTVVDLGSEVFERYYAESATNGRTADLILAGGADNWADFVAKAGAIDYTSPELAGLPDDAQTSPGIYTVTADPAVIVYNKQILSEAEAPKSLKALADLIGTRPDLKSRIVTQTTAVPFGRTAAWAWVQHNPDAWDTLAKIGPSTRVERAVGSILEKITTGEYALGFFVNGSALLTKMTDPAFVELIGWSFIEDGTPIVPRRIAIPNNAKNQSGAKLLLDYLLSHEGQVAFGMTGVTAYRTDVKQDEVAGYPYGAIVEQVGADNIAFEHDDAAYVAGREAFLEKMKSIFGQDK